MTQPHDEKFAGFMRACERAREKNVCSILIDNPLALGDTYDELIQNLSLLAAYGLTLRIISPSHRHERH